MPRKFPGLKLQDEPAIWVAVISGRWLLERTTPSWRIEDPVSGFQRRVDQDRAKEIATTVLDAGRTFPNAIVLATNVQHIDNHDCIIEFPEKVKFLVVDGQHRLWAQHFSKVAINYCCLIHLGLTEKEMAQLFVEINDNQKRVPSSLRWDLVRLVRREDDPNGVRAVDLLYDLNNIKSSPLFQRIDLTGEQKEISIKQGSLAPPIKSLVSKRGSGLFDVPYDLQLKVLIAFFSSIRELDSDGWDNANGRLYKARVLRALLRLLMDILEKEVHKGGATIAGMTARKFLAYINRIDLGSLDPDEIRGQQGAAGVKAIYDTIRGQVFR